MPTLDGIYPRFVAVDADGRRHTLKVMPGIRGTPTASDPHGKVPGAKRVVDEAGQVVERVGRGAYVTTAGERLSSDDPDAP